MANSQYSISYPNPAQGLTVCAGESIITIRIDVTSSSVSNSQVIINLPPGIAYQKGSVEKIATGSSENLTISENGGTLYEPKFDIGPQILTLGNHITFSIKRKAECNAREHSIIGKVFKDTITVTGNAGTISETSNSINAYNVIYPSLSIEQPATITNAVIGGSYTRTFKVTNGAPGDALNVNFYIIYPENGIEYKSVTLQQISAAGEINMGEIISPVHNNSDTLFFNVSGKQLGNDGIFSKDESLLITEKFILKKCNAISKYSTGWGCNSGWENLCQASNGIGTIEMAQGVPIFSDIKTSVSNFVDMCTPFDVTAILTNGGSVNDTAATMFDVAVLVGNWYGGNQINGLDLNFITLNNVRVGNVKVPFSFPGNVLTIPFANVLKSDPDGEGTGLEDVDGDGFFDDLPRGNSLTYTFTKKFSCNYACGSDLANWYFANTLSYYSYCELKNIMLTPKYFNAVNFGNFENFNYYFSSKSFVPGNIINKTNFRVYLDVGWYANYSVFDNENTRYRWKLHLPKGVKVAGNGNAKYGDENILFSVNIDTLVVLSPTNQYKTFSIDLVYDCENGSGGTIPFWHSLEKIDNLKTGCYCNFRKLCSTIYTNALCANNCKNGPYTLIPEVRRTDGSLGWTDYTLTKRQESSIIDAYDLSKALYLDTILIRGSAIQNNTAANLFVELTLDKTTGQPAGINKLTPLEIKASIFRNKLWIKTSEIANSTQTNSDSKVQRIVWDLTSGLANDRLKPGDSIFVEAKCWVSINDGLPLNDVQSGKSWSFFNITNNQRNQCNSVVPEMYLIGTNILNGRNVWTSNSCNNTDLAGANHIARRFNSSGTLFKNEVRPVFKIEKYEMTIPDGYELVSCQYLNHGTGRSFPMGITLSNKNLYSFEFPKDWPPLFLTVENGYGGNILPVLRPNCKTQNLENINVKTYIGDFVYAYYGKETPPEHYKILEGISGRNQMVEYSPTTKPSISVSNLTGTVQAFKKTHSWKFRISNPSATTAPYVWVAIPYKTNFTILELKDLTTGKVLSPDKYSNGIWFKVDKNGIPSGKSFDFEITLRINDCETDSFNIIAGWNCSNFPESPELYPCEKNEIWFNFISQKAEVEIIPIDVPPANIDLCKPYTYRYLIRNTQASNTFNNRFLLIVPEGIILTNKEIEMEYPSGKGNWQKIFPSSLNSEILEFDLTRHPNFPNEEGLPGTLNELPADFMQIGLRFEISTDCNFTSGRNYILSASATMPCGKPIESNTLKQSPPVNIKGVSATYYTSNSVSVSNHVSCGKTAILGIETVILSNPTGANNYVVIELPQGVRFVEYLGCNNQSTCPILTGTFIKADGTQEITIKFHASLPAGTILKYSFLIYSVKEAIPGQKTIHIDATEQFSNIPCETSPDKVCFALKVSTGTGQGTVYIDEDVDCNGIPYSKDIDDDNDGIIDSVEGDGKQDSDSDRIPDSLDIDSDNDGIPDIIEAQGESGFIFPLGVDTDLNGLDDAFDLPGNKGLKPIDTDSDNIPDYLDSDSDNDGVPDIIEGCDANSDGKPDRLVTFGDSDKDGLMDTFDNYVFNNKIEYAKNVIGSNAALQDFDKDKIRDWRDTDDDNDLVLTQNEDFNKDKKFDNDDLDLDGHPDYLDASLDCELFIPEGFSPNNDGIHDFFQILCIQNYPNARLMVFNRQGIKVFEKSNYGNLKYWGSNENAWWWGIASYSYTTGYGQLPMGNYYYILELEPGNRKTGTVMVAY